METDVTMAWRILIIVLACRNRYARKKIIFTWRGSVCKEKD